MRSNFINSAPKRRALVLSGGSVKGAYQAGVVERLFDYGFAPDAVYGVSVGALNGLFIAHASGHNPSSPFVDWQTIGKQLRSFWLDNITTPNSIARKRSTPALALRVLFKQHAGFLDTRELRGIVTKLDKAQLTHSKTEFYAGVVDLNDSTYEDVGHKHPRIHDYVMASSSLPLLMPIEKIGSRALQDGGLINVTPINKAIKQGADQIVVVMCQEEDFLNSPINTGDIFQQTERVITVLNNEVIRQDLEMVVKINQYLIECGPTPPPEVGFMKGKKMIDITIIRPEKELKIDIRNFKSDDIHSILEVGRSAAEKERANRGVGW